MVISTRQVGREQSPFTPIVSCRVPFFIMSGVDIIISYFTPEVLIWLKEDEKAEADNLTKLMQRLEPKVKNPVEGAGAD